MIMNASTGLVLAHNVHFARNILAQATGLMFRSKLHDKGWVFLLPYTSSWPITNMFVFQTITVVWLNEQKEVIQIMLVRPFAIHVKGKIGSRFCVELPPEAFSRVKIGDILSW